MDKIQHGEVTEEADNHWVEKYRNISLTKTASTSGVMVLKKVAYVGMNDCEHLEHSISLV